MSLNRITKLLNKLGFSNLDVRVYVFIAKLGPLSDEEIAVRTNIGFEQLKPILQNLTKKGIITSTFRNQPVYIALSFEDLLDEYIKLEIKQAEELRKDHQQLISTWKSLAKRKDE